MRELATVYINVDAVHYSWQGVLNDVMPWLEAEIIHNHGIWDRCIQVGLQNTNCKHRRYYISAEKKLKVLD